VAGRNSAEAPEDPKCTCTTSHPVASSATAATTGSTAAHRRARLPRVLPFTAGPVKKLKRDVIVFLLLSKRPGADRKALRGPRDLLYGMTGDSTVTGNVTLLSPRA
jgi:hypothetical protein